MREVAVEGRAPRFDAKGMRHHHFICDRCGNVEDIEWYDVPRLPRAPSVSGFFANANSFSGDSALSASLAARFPLSIAGASIPDAWRASAKGGRRLPIGKARMVLYFIAVFLGWYEGG